MGDFDTVILYTSSTFTICLYLYAKYTKIYRGAIWRFPPLRVGEEVKKSETGKSNQRDRGGKQKMIQDKKVNVFFCQNIRFEIMMTAGAINSR